MAGLAQSRVKPAPTVDQYAGPVGAGLPAIERVAVVIQSASDVLVELASSPASPAPTGNDHAGRSSNLDARRATGFLINAFSVDVICNGDECLRRLEP
ncbi:hypothetical protein D9M71_602080 [compost metagenome]